MNLPEVLPSDFNFDDERTRNRVFDGLCRVCLQHWSPENVLTPLIQDDKLTDYATAVITFADIQIEANDGLPFKICPSCLDLLKKAIQFKLTCEETNENLQNLKMEESDLKYAIVKYSIEKHYLPEKESNDGNSEDEYECDDRQMSFSESDYEPIKIHKVNKRKKKKTGKTKKVKLEKDNPKPVPICKQTPICPICNKQLSCRSSLLSHMQRHGDKKFICEICAKKFSSNAELRMHRLYKHNYEGKYGCTQCNFRAKDRRQLRVHVNKHLGLRPYKCNVCDKSFFAVQIYSLHMRNHANGKQFKCERCPLAFYTRGLMNAHFERAHEKKYLYQCSIPDCQTAFREGGSVRRHLASAHGIPRDQQGPIKRIPTASVQTLLDTVRLRPNSVHIMPE